MPFYIRARQQDIPTPTISSVGSDDDDNYLTDPGQIFDKLPQPFRLIDKALNEIFEISWEKISALEEAREREAKQTRPPAHSPSVTLDQYPGITCGCLATDELLFGGTNSTIIALNVGTGEVLSTWVPDDKTCVEQIHCAQVGCTDMYIIAFIDDMGFAKLLLFETNMFHFVCCINELVEGSPKSNAFKCELSKDGCFYAAACCCENSSWVDVFKLPLEPWTREIENARKEFLKKVEAATSQLSADEVSNEDGNLQSSSSELSFPVIKFSSLIPTLKVPQPIGVAARTFKTPADMLEEVGNADVIGGGTCHVMTEKFLNLQGKLFDFLNDEDLQYIEEETSVSQEAHPTFHFLHQSCMERPLQTKPESIYTNIGIWWSEHHNFNIYQLNKTGKSVEFGPDAVWPQSSNITCTSLGDRGRFLAIGTEGGDISLWDRALGTVRCVVHLPNSQPVSDILFLKVEKPHPVAHPFKHQYLGVELLIGTAKGQVHLLRCDAAEDLKAIVPAQQNGHPKYALIRVIPHLSNSFILVDQEGSISLIAAGNGEIQCTFILPEGYHYEHPMNTGIFIDDAGKTLYVRGGTLSSEDSSLLFAFHLAPHLDAYQMTAEDESATSETNLSFADGVQALLTQRMQRQASRTTILASRWHNLHKQLDFVLNLKETVRKREKQYSQSSSTASRWSKTTTKIIAHNKDLKL